MKHMPQGDDLILIVLKGHLLIEEMLQEIIDISVANPAELENARFSFAHKLCLARALDHDHEPKRQMFLLIEKVNALRNQLAHNLEPADLERRVRDVVSLFLSEVDNPQSRDVYKAEPVPEQLRTTCLFLLGFLGSLLKHSTFMASVAKRFRDVDAVMERRYRETGVHTPP